MTKIQEICKEVLRHIKPSQEEESALQAKIDRFLCKINPDLAKIHAKAILGGSGAKGTWLKNVHDADIFVQFDYAQYKNCHDKISDYLESSLKLTIKNISRVHGSRDYFEHTDQDGFKFEIIPILKIDNAEDALNITDISPLHADWVRKKTNGTDEIRLVKQFARANGVYGAESYVKGFSGYVLEILTIHYGTFEKFIKAVAKWKDQESFDVEKHHRNIRLEVNLSKIEGPLIVIDPVQAGRNAAAAISGEKYDILRESAKSFAQDPRAAAFEEKAVRIKDIRKLGKNVLIIKAIPLEGKEDIVGCKLLKAYEHIKDALDEFVVIDSGWIWDKMKEAAFWYQLNTTELPEYREWEGPPMTAKAHVDRFKQTHKDTYAKDGRIFAKVSVEHRTPKDKALVTIELPFVKDKAESFAIES